MPEGHTIHRLARQQQKLFGGQPVRVSSPQGRFSEGASLLDGHVLARTEAVGKHLLQHYRDAPSLHVHLGLYGKFATGVGEPPVPVGALRLRLQAGENWTDLRGPTACELIEPAEIAALFARLGPDPLRPGADPSRAERRIARSRTSIAALLMDQQVIAGIGNVYRAELLFRHRVDPFLPGQSLGSASWLAMWTDLVALMRAGVWTGRIETVRPEDRVRKRGPLNRSEAGYVYRRAGLPCRVCGTEIRTEVLVGRNLFWCPYCQPPGAH
ncbi:MAG: Fpg/Nei family DNA glycosylase [Actinomycetota bacterium]|nr:Fpg/Nei family DNA glycosylase [Actinomycetota bacterium]MDQ2955959.1 Fpg/Nei family DNA glycosylase [Actinomycetota bacterium]